MGCGGSVPEDLQAQQADPNDPFAQFAPKPAAPAPAKEAPKGEAPVPAVRADRRSKREATNREEATAINVDIHQLDKQGRPLGVQARKQGSSVTKRAANPMEIFSGHYERVTCLFTRDTDDWVISAGECNTVYKWNFNEGKQQHEIAAVIDGHKQPITACIVKDEKTLITTGIDGVVCYRYPGKIPAICVYDCEILCICVPPKPFDDDFEYVGDARGCIHFNQGFRGTKTGATIKAHSAGVAALTLSIDRKSVISCGEDGFLKEWPINLRNGFIDKQKFQLMAHEGGCLCIDVNKEKQWYITGGADNLIKIWGLNPFDEAAGWSMLRMLSGHTDEVRSVIMTPALEIVSCGPDKSVRVWNSSEGQCTGALTGKQVNKLAYNDKRKTIYFGCEDKTIKTWVLDPFTGGLVTGFPAPS